MQADEFGPPGQVPLGQVLSVEPTSETEYGSTFRYDAEHNLFGGQVVAQALMAAGHGLPAERWPHSLHAEFLRRGETEQLTHFTVSVEAEGRRFSRRRVVARQQGRPILSMAASFHEAEAAPDAQLHHAPTSWPPVDPKPWRLPRAPAFEVQAVTSDIHLPERPARFWARCRDTIGSTPLANASALAYLCDATNAVNYFSNSSHRASTSLNYSVWFHRAAMVSEWSLVDLTPHTVAHGRGFYTGAVYSASGVLLASLAQETLFHPREE